MLYIVSEYANQGEIFGKICYVHFVFFEKSMWRMAIKNHTSIRRVQPAMPIWCLRRGFDVFICLLFYLQTCARWNGCALGGSWLLLYIIKINFNILLADYIARYGKMNERTARQKFWQILSAVEYCHNRNIVHRDLKVSCAYYSVETTRSLCYFSVRLKAYNILF